MPLLTGYGAPPAGVNWWEGNRFMMPGLLMPPPPPAPPPPPQTPPLDASQWVPDARQWTSSPSNDPGGMQSGASGIMDQRTGTHENPATTISTGQMARETGGMIGRAALDQIPFVSGPPGWGSLAGTALGLATGMMGPGLIGTMGDIAFNASKAFGRSPMGQTTYDDQGQVVSAPSGMSRSEIADMNDVVSRGQRDWDAMSPEQQASLERAVADSIAANPDIFGTGGGGGGHAPGGTQSVADPFRDMGPDPFGGPSFGDGWFAKGGTIKRGLLDIDPPGTDDTVIAAQKGEGVVTKAAMKRHPGLLAAWNRGDTGKMRSLLRAR